ncbi:unnamed protein product [marine sediment metagenome]|uniref:Phage replisome organiser N-terminal domain-containing protein n=1 Tax=marine sediment metagenome TaxID=412755 RepID=X1A0L2_9ZZZZ
MTLYRIRDWDKHYETSESRKRSTPLKWLAVPVKLNGYGYVKIMSQRSGDKMYGCWGAILLLAACCTPRGTLQDGDGNPYSLEDIARMIRMPIATVRLTVNFLSDKHNAKLMWIEALQSKPAENASPPAESGKKTGLQHSGICNGTVSVDQEKEFDLIWSKYPRKLGKKEAFRHFRASVKTEDDVAAIHAALNCFMQQMETEGRAPDKIPYGSKWFNNWPDWIGYEPPPTPKTPEEIRRERERMERGKLYECTQCAKKHATMDGGMCEECYQRISKQRQEQEG